MAKKKNVHGVALGDLRWKGKTKAQKRAHGKMMAEKRWAAHRARKALEKTEETS